MKINILVFLLSVVILFSGCTDKPIINTQKENPTYQSEFEDLSIKVKENFHFDSKNYEENYNLKVTIDEKDDRIVYTIIVSNPKQEMDNVIISSYLDPQIFIKLKTPTIFFTSLNEQNVNPVLVDGKEYTVFGAFPIDKNQIDDSFKKNMQNLYIKVSWVTKEGEKRVNYILFKGEITKKLSDYINNLNGSLY